MGAFAGMLAGLSGGMEQEHKEQFETELAKRKTLTEMFLKDASDPNNKPWHQQDAIRRLGMLIQTPYNKKLPSDVENLKTYGQRPAQVAPQPGQTMPTTTTATVPFTAPPPPPTEAPGGKPAGVLQGGANEIPPPPPMNMGPQSITQTLTPPPPPVYAGPATESGRYTPQEGTQLAVDKQRALADETMRQHQALMDSDRQYRTKVAADLGLEGRDKNVFIATAKFPNINISSLLTQGYKLDEDGNIVPMDPTELSPVQRSKVAAQEAMVGYRQALGDLAKAKADPNSPYFKLAMERLQQTRQRLGIMGGNLALRRLDYEAKYLGTMNGEPIPGGPLDPETGKPMGITTFTATRPTTTMRSKAEQGQVVINSGNELIQKIKDAQDVLGPMAGRISSLEVGIGSADPVVRDLYTSMKSFAALQPALHGSRGVGMQKEFEAAAARLADDPQAGIAAVQSLMQQAQNFVKVGLPQRQKQEFGGGPPPPPNTGPKKGDKRSYQGHTYTFDGTQWVR